MKWCCILVCVFLAGVSATAQKMYKQKKPATQQRHYNEVLPKYPQYKMNGWFFAPGLTYTLTRFIPRSETLAESATQKFEGKFTPVGKPGLYAEFGRYRMLPNGGIFKYFDYGISYKMLRGSERSKGDWMAIPAETVLSSEQGTGKFSHHYAEIFINFNHIWRTGRYTFLQHSIGANAGYGFIRSMSGSPVSAALPLVSSPGSWLAQLHYKLGYGIKMRGNWLLIPAVETPVLNLLPFEVPRSTLGFFTSRYRPLMFSLRFFFMRPADNMECKPVKTREGLIMPTDMDKQRQMNEGK